MIVMENYLKQMEYNISRLEGDSRHQEVKDILLLGQLPCFLSFRWLHLEEN